jgi:hypothetical protein
MRQIGNQGVVYAALEATAAAESFLHAPMTLIHRDDESRPTVLSFIAEARRLAATYP